jgi:hypothetical protein
MLLLCAENNARSTRSMTKSCALLFACLTPPYYPGASLVIDFTLATINKSVFPVSAHVILVQFPPETQWLIEDAGNGLYYIKSWKGVYVTYTGTPQSDTPLTCTSTKSAFRIIKDSIDPSCFKLVTLTVMHFSHDHVISRVLHPTLDLSMDLSRSSAALDTPIILYQTHTGRNQAWVFKFTTGPRPKFDPNFAPAFFVRRSQKLLLRMLR